MVDKAQGQIWWANLSEPLGWRPVLILTRDEALRNLHYVTVAPLTRTTRGIDSEVIVDPDDGVPTRSAVTLDNIATNRAGLAKPVHHDHLVGSNERSLGSRSSRFWHAVLSTAKARTFGPVTLAAIELRRVIAAR
jgi:mRNA interferase MazF